MGWKNKEAVTNPGQWGCRNTRTGDMVKFPQNQLANSQNFGVSTPKKYLSKYSIIQIHGSLVERAQNRKTALCIFDENL